MIIFVFWLNRLNNKHKALMFPVVEYAKDMFVWIVVPNDEVSVYFTYNETFCSNKHIHWFYPFLPFFSVLHILSFGFLWISWCKRKHRLSCEDVSSSASNEINGHTLLFLFRICPSLFSHCSIFFFFYRCQHLTSSSSSMTLSIILFHHQLFS